MESITDRLVHELSSNSTVNASADRAYDATSRADQIANPLDLLADELFLDDL